MNDIKAKQKRIYNTYGLEWDEYELKVSKGCQICGTKKGILCVDHIHTAGYKDMEPKQRRKYVRGILCFLCNTAVGKLERTKDGKANRQRLEGIVEYFKVYPIKGEI